ncbi:peptidase C14 caspase catalytic subunit p20 [Calothrix parasitica NIES-267]|uniref:Peptidase C14 caspase catalytic subunit p20 n=1 Tax=Calothrix parasitica NIES-267 TaxID=1973488 RepID=A0A1Z4LJG7_9CYAN|nr:peptidase C14 caspase catalytic subunit p20 [Calothrix parasitica NIES-267]
MPLGIGSSDSSYTLKSGEAKLWLLLVGVNDYQDSGLPSLRYPALDCQGLEESLVKATEGFPNKEIVVHHDFASKTPELNNIRESLKRIVLQSQPNDSIMLYFSGHGMVDQKTQAAVLCFSDTNQNNLLNTGLPMQELVEILSKSPAKQQLLCLDTCHSGDMGFLGSNGISRDAETPAYNSTPQLMSVLRQKASQSKGFCALLSCDRGQKSWEFPELGHGVFTYYLMKGLSGEAADNTGFIDADGLYKYVYRQTVQYIDKLNHQVRLINEQKLARGDSRLYLEYPKQTPKRIVEGVGELIVGYKPSSGETQNQKLRRAFVVDGLINRDSSNNLSRVLAGAGGFEVECFHQQNKNWLDIRGEIQKFIQTTEELNKLGTTKIGRVDSIPTCFLYLRGCVKETEDGEGRLILGSGVYLSRSYFRKILRQARKTQQIVILNLVSPDSGASSAQNWIEDLQSSTEYGQCLIITQTSIHKSEDFCQTLVQTLASANPQLGLPVAKWITQLNKQLQSKDINLKTWFSGTQAIIDILPGGIDRVFQEIAGNIPEKAAIPPKAVTKLKISLPTPQNLIINHATYSKLETLLKHSVGIIASAILQQCIEKSANNEELIGYLTEYISLQQKTQFQNQAKSILETSEIEPQIQQAKSPVALEPSIDSNFIKKCERDLTYLIGPIANFIIEEILESNPQISTTELINRLANKVPDPGMAEEFKKRVLG